MDNEFLISPFSDKEFRTATLSMHLDKSPSCDGLNAAFYQKFWSMCGNDMVMACQS